MYLSDFNLTPAQQDELLTQEINRRVRKGATLLSVDGSTAILRYGPEMGKLDLAYIVTMWAFQITPHATASPIKEIPRVRMPRTIWNARMTVRS